MNKRNKTIIILSILTIIFMIIGGTLAYWRWTSSNEQKTNVTFTVGANFSCSANGGGDINNNSGTLAPAHCTNATKAIKRTVTASVVKNGANNIFLDMYLNVNSIDPALANTENFRYAFTTGSTSCDDGVISQGNFKGAAQNSHMSLIKGKEYNTTTNNDTYYLWIWLDYPETNSETMNKNFSVSLAGTCTDNPDTYSCPIPQYDNTQSTPSQPVLDTGMIPVKISNNGLVTAVAANDPTWYNYSDKQWANAVLVKENGLRTRAENKVAGTNINQDDILAYFVWIPRYKYAIPEPLTCGCIDGVNPTDYPKCYNVNLTTEDKNALCSWLVSLGNSTNQSDCLSELQQLIDHGADMSPAIDMYNDANDSDLALTFLPGQQIIEPRQINIIFENKNTAKSNGTAINKSYYTHPAFTFGNQELDGIWVGKFEPSHATLSFSSMNGDKNNLNCTNTTCSNANGIRIIPNVLNLRFNNLSNMFFAARSMEQPDNSFGIVSSDSHMIKDSEWGAVAYLSRSKYGINTEVRINNNRDVTGCGALNVDGVSTNDCEIRYGNAYSYPQSTTGNISGIFDMAGGLMEYSMGHWSDNLNEPEFEQSGFNVMPESKYYDLYDSSIFNGNYETNFDNCTLTTCGGRALVETRYWWSSRRSYFVDTETPWSVYGSNGGIFYHAQITGFGGYSSFRIVLVEK